MENSNDYHQLHDDPDNGLKNIYSIHFDTTRIILFSLVVFLVVAGTFAIGLYVGESNAKIYENKYALGLSDVRPRENRDLALPSLDNIPKTDSDLLAEKNHIMKISETSKPQNDIDSVMQPLKKNDALLMGHQSKTKSQTIETSANSSKNKKPKVIAVSRPSDDSQTQNRESNNRTSVLNQYPIKPGYQIQVASLNKLSQAKKLQQDLQTLGYNAHISARQGTSRIHYRVSFGNGLSLPDLEQDLHKIRQERADFAEAFIIKM